MPIPSGIEDASMYIQVMSWLRSSWNWARWAMATASFGSGHISTVYGSSLSQGEKWKCLIFSSDLGSAWPWIKFLIRSSWMGLVRRGGVPWTSLAGSWLTGWVGTGLRMRISYWQTLLRSRTSVVEGRLLLSSG